MCIYSLFCQQFIGFLQYLSTDINKKKNFVEICYYLFSLYYFLLDYTPVRVDIGKTIVYVLFNIKSNNSSNNRQQHTKLLSI